MGIHQERTKTRNRRLIKFLKTNCPCVDCGEFFEHYKMDFDHIRDKKHTVSQMMSYCTDTVMDEIEKCEIVCKMCHADRTHTRIIEGEAK